MAVPTHSQLDYYYYYYFALCVLFSVFMKEKKKKTDARDRKADMWDSNAAAAAKSRQSCPTLCNPIDGSPPGSCPWDSPSKNAGVGCNFFLQCMKEKSESEVAQSCPTLSDPMDFSLPGSSIRDFPGKSTKVGCHCLLRDSNNSELFRQSVAVQSLDQCL